VDHRYRGPQEVKRGGMLVIPIHFTGSPRPKVTWYHRGVPLTSRPGHVHADYGDGYSTLTISGIESNESGKYEAVVENVAGAAKLDFDVIVKCMLNSFRLCEGIKVAVERKETKSMERWKGRNRWDG